MSLYDLLGVNYSFCTLFLAVIFPIISAASVFLFFYRATAIRKILVYFISMPIYILICIFVLSDPSYALSQLSSVIDVGFLESHGNSINLCGFLLALILGTVYIYFVMILCGRKLLKAKAIAVNTVFFATTIAANVFLTYVTVLLNKSTTPMLSDIWDLFGIFQSPNNFVYSISNIGIDVVILSFTAIYIFIFFVSQINAKPQYDIVLATKSASDEYTPDIEPMCEFCEYARPLKDDLGKVLCDKCGVVSCDHNCRSFVYDPLKRKPRRSKPNFYNNSK